MKTFNLFGINALGHAVKLGKEVISFTDDKKQFSIIILDSCYVQMTTAKGVYNLSKHPTLNYYNATINGHKVQIHLDKVVGWLKFW
jgi:hypothetical protein